MGNNSGGGRNDADNGRGPTASTRQTEHTGLTLRLLKMTPNALETKRRKTPTLGKKGSAAVVDGAGSIRDA